jgi:hypothetical protein
MRRLRLQVGDGSGRKIESAIFARPLARSIVVHTGLGARSAGVFLVFDFACPSGRDRGFGSVRLVWAQMELEIWRLAELGGIYGKDANFGRNRRGVGSGPNTRVFLFQELVRPNIWNRMKKNISLHQNLFSWML